MPELVLKIAPDGEVTSLYSDQLDLRELGQVRIARASHVEPTAKGCHWVVDLRPSGGGVYAVDEAGQEFTTRAEALAFERRWLESRLFAS